MCSVITPSATECTREILGSAIVGALSVRMIEGVTRDRHRRDNLRKVELTPLYRTCGALGLVFDVFPG